MIKHFKRHYFLLFCLTLFCGDLFAAGSATRTLSVSASVAQICSITTTTALAFAVYDPVGANATVPLNATGQISVACSKGSTSMTIGMGDGAHVSGTHRQMIGSTSSNLLQYSVFQPPGNAENTLCTFPGTIAWSNVGAGLLTLTSAPSKTARVYNVCGTIAAGQDVSVDTYLDTITASINF